MRATNPGLGALSSLRMRAVPRIFLFFALACSAAVTRAQDHPASAELLADVSTIKPGEPFRVGILISMKPGWHVYWLNPGDAGQPPEVKWTLPDGFVVSDLQFPAPKRFEESGGIVGYGYDKEVLLTATVTPPADLKPGEPRTIKADVNWLVCEAVCLPGDASLAIDVSVAESAAPSNRSLFESWQARVPRAPDDLGAEVRMTTQIDTKTVSIDVDWKNQPPKSAEWFPPPSDDVVFTDIVTRTDGTRTTITARFSTMAKKPLPQETLRSVLAYDRGDGVRRGLSVPVDFAPQNNRVGSTD